jgi:hypothetical protein
MAMQDSLMAFERGRFVVNTQYLLLHCNPSFPEPRIAPATPVARLQSHRKLIRSSAAGEKTREHALAVMLIASRIQPINQR